MTRAFDSKKFLERWRTRKDRDEWLFAVAIARVGLEREGNLDGAAEQELTTALDEFGLSHEELNDYIKKNRRKLLRFLDSRQA